MANLTKGTGSVYNADVIGQNYNSTTIAVLADTGNADADVTGWPLWKPPVACVIKSVSVVLGTLPTVFSSTATADTIQMIVKNSGSSTTTIVDKTFTAAAGVLDAVGIYTLGAVTAVNLTAGDVVTLDITQANGADLAGSSISIQIDWVARDA